MTMNGMFLAVLALAIGLIYWWGFTRLPGERWQIMAAVPRIKAGHHWTATNLTWYGFLFAGACAVGVALLFILLGALGIPCLTTIVLCLVMFGVCLPGAKIVARLVERKKHTLTVGGAILLGILIFPAVLWLLNRILPEHLIVHTTVITVLSALAITYTFGEGLGRLACISFGCCYGKPIDNLPAWLHRMFAQLNFTFRGPTKKIAYAHGLDGVKVVPVQAITAVIYALAGLGGVWLFLDGHYTAALLLTLLVTQAWRVASEFLRVDYRGGGIFPSYQIMAVITAIAAIGMSVYYQAADLRPLIMTGLTSLWDPLTLLFLQGLWLAVFLSVGRSSVTGAQVTFHVVHERV